MNLIFFYPGRAGYFCLLLLFFSPLNCSHTELYHIASLLPDQNWGKVEHIILIQATKTQVSFLLLLLLLLLLRLSAILQILQLYTCTNSCDSLQQASHPSVAQTRETYESHKSLTCNTNLNLYIIDMYYFSETSK